MVLIPARWPDLARFRRAKVRTQDDQIREWKTAWNAGAQARWAGRPFIVANPTSTHGAAWQAGWRWANGQPDRRQRRKVRFAHPLRRSGDGPGTLLSSARAGAVGVSLVTMFAWLWRSRSRRVAN